MEDDDKILRGEAAAQCGCCELPFFIVSHALILTSTLDGHDRYDGSITTLCAYDMFNPPVTWYRKYVITATTGGTITTEGSIPYVCHWVKGLVGGGDDIEVQENTYTTTVAGDLTGSVASRVFSLSFDHEQAARDALSALFAVDPEPNVNPSNGYHAGDIAEYIYTNTVGTAPSRSQINGKVKYSEYYWYVPPFGVYDTRVNYIKIVWDIARIVYNSTSYVVDADVLDTDLECVFDNVLNYGDANDTRRASSAYSALPLIQSEVVTANVEVGNTSHFRVVNMRVYRSPSVKQYLTYGYWVEAGVVTFKDTWRYES